MIFFSYYENDIVKFGVFENGEHFCLTDIKDISEIFEIYGKTPEKLLENRRRIEGEIKFAPAVQNPQKILCVGLNYENHIGEMKHKKLEVPTIFGKYSNALSAHGEKIKLPYEGGHYDYEAELVAVIGKECRNVSAKEAEKYIFGYTCGNDLSVREIQKRTSQWLLGKSFDKFAPLGPYIVTADSVDISNLAIKSYVNGSVRQDARTSDMIFGCAEIVSHVSGYMTLLPGDVIYTGTPGGVILGKPENEQKWLESGDRVDIEIENIGKLTTYLI